jgi:hypothetical protein
MSLKPNPKEINIILNILKGAQFEFLPWAPFYIDMPLSQRKKLRGVRSGDLSGLMILWNFLLRNIHTVNAKCSSTSSCRKNMLCLQYSGKSLRKSVKKICSKCK